MTVSEPIYTPENCRPAFQLTWSLTVFWRQPAPPADWLESLQAATELDGVRVLEHRLTDPRVSQFLISTTPAVSPHALVRSVSGRLQYLVRRETPKPFQRNYALRSVGWVKREDVERYVQGQTGRHPMADPRAQAILERYQICNPDVDLARPRQGTHGMYWYNLHVVMVYSDRLPVIREPEIARMHGMILGVAKKYGDLLSSAGLVGDHVHLALGAPPEESPQEVAMRYMNNLAYCWGMKRMFNFGYYTGTHGEYDLGAIPR